MNILKRFASLFTRNGQRAVTAANEGSDSAVENVPTQSPDPNPSNQSNDDLSQETNDAHSLISPIGRDISISCIIRCSRADYGSIACLNSSFRALVSSSDIYNMRREIGNVEHWVYVSCQTSEWAAFDPIRRRWTRVPRMEPTKLFVHADKESLGVGTEILVFGHDFLHHVIYHYSLLSNSWTTVQPTCQQRFMFASASFEGKAIVAGGCDSEGDLLSSAELYDSDTRTWKQLRDMNKPRTKCSGVFMDGKFYVVGGTGESGFEHFSCGEEYDLEADSWREIPNMSPVRTYVGVNNDLPASSEVPPLIAVVNNETLFSAHLSDMAVRRYVKETGTWLTVGRLPGGERSVLRWSLAFKGCGDRLVVVSVPRDEGGDGGGGLGFVEIHSWVSSEGPILWDLIGRRRLGSFISKCSVMGC